MVMSATSRPDPSSDGPQTPSDGLELLDWRRRIAELYARVRTTDPLAAWQEWRSVRDKLFRHHSQSPIELQDRAEFVGLPYFPYDPSFRFLVDIGEPQSRAPVTMGVGGDGEVCLH